MAKNFQDAYEKQLDKHWDETKDARSGARGIDLDEGSYVGIQIFESGVAERGNSKGAPQLTEKLEVSEGEDQGTELPDRRYTFSSQKFEQRGEKVSMAKLSQEKLNKRVKQMMPERIEEFEAMTSKEFMAFVMDELLDTPRTVRFKVEDGGGDIGKYTTIEEILEDSDDDSEEVVDDEITDDDEIEGELDPDSDNDEGDDDDDENEEFEGSKGDYVMWQAPKAKRPGEWQIVGVQPSKNTLTLKNSRGTKHTQVPMGEVELLEEDEE